MIVFPLPATVTADAVRSQLLNTAQCERCSVHAPPASASASAASSTNAQAFAVVKDVKEALRKDGVAFGGSTVKVVAWSEAFQQFPLNLEPTKHSVTTPPVSHRNPWVWCELCCGAMAYRSPRKRWLRL